MRTSLFWAITRRVVLIYYRLFEQTVGPILGIQELDNNFFFGPLNVGDGPDKLSRNVGNKLPLLAA
jgi:hypothetical protein